MYAILQKKNCAAADGGEAGMQRGRAQKAAEAQVRLLAPVQTQHTQSISKREKATHGFEGALEPMVGSVFQIAGTLIAS